MRGTDTGSTVLDGLAAGKLAKSFKMVDHVGTYYEMENSAK